MNARMQATDWTAERIARLLNKAKKSPTGWKACCPAHEDSDPSLFIADGDDGIAMRCYAGCSYRDISDALKQKGVELFPSSDRREIPREHFQLGGYHSHWDYHDSIGQIVMRICRWEQPGGKKDIRPLVRTSDGWKWQHHPAPRPLYQLDRLVNDADVPAIVVEGEKTAAAAQKLFPHHIATTWAGGASAMGQADWAPLAGRDVVLIPDCDAPGRKAVQWLRNHLEKIAKNVRVIDPSTFDASLTDGWDLADALKEQRDVSEWLISVKEVERDEPPAIEARVFEWIESKQIPPRPWLYSHHYMRGMVSATAGVGGAGKSTLLNVELISMAIGKDLLRGGQEIPVGPLTVWGHNGEDPYQELQRRILAICQHYGVTVENLGGRLRITSGRDIPIMVARELTEGGKVLVPTEDGKQIGAEILKHGIQVFVADPFVTIHRVNENDNVQIDGVLTILRDLAHSTNSAVEVAHHFRKLNGDEANVDAIRGASSLSGACRSVRIVSAMNKEDATKYGIDDEQRGFYSWLQNAKANNLPPTHRRHWLFMESVDLDNAQPPYESDKIGVATSWLPPDTGIELTAPEFRMIRSAIQQADPLKALRADVRSSGWIGKLLASVLERNVDDKVVKSEMAQIIAHLERGRHIKQQPVRDPRQSRMAACYLWIGGAHED
jgi:hypothetical protein